MGERAHLAGLCAAYAVSHLLMFGQESARVLTRQPTILARMNIGCQASTGVRPSGTLCQPGDVRLGLADGLILIPGNTRSRVLALTAVLSARRFRSSEHLLFKLAHTTLKLINLHLQRVNFPCKHIGIPQLFFARRL
jgi:hypothetical protein